MSLEAFGTGQGYLKAGFFGFAKSGKSYTATLLALETWKRIGLKTPIAIQDTEGGAEYLVPLIKKATGQNPIGQKSRALKDLMNTGIECEAGASGILIVDSITHIWREVCDAYLDQVNKAREAQHKPKRTRLEFQDWANIKSVWNRWTDFYLNSGLHILICGRAGFEWNFEDHEDASGQPHRELVKTGTKMKVESEFGFEPSLLVEMERVQVPDPTRPERFKIVHRATVIGDRFDAMDGLTCENPTSDWFAPYLAMLVPGAVNVVDTELKTDMGVDEQGQTQFDAERRERSRILEEIEGELVAAYPGQTAAEKKFKANALQECYGTRSWTAIKGKSTSVLAAGLISIREYVVKNPKE